jgi:HK97 family phage major capsid protein
MDTKILNTTKEELLQKQTNLLMKARESKKWDAEDKKVFDALTVEINEVSEDIKRYEFVNKGKLEIATPRQTAAIVDSSKTSKFMAFAGSYNPSKVLNVTEDHVSKFWAACKNPATFQKWQIENSALGEGGTAADGSALVPIMTDPTIPALQIVECSARSLSKVIPTDRNINFPFQSAKSVASIKAETNNSSTNSFGTSVPQFAFTTLGANVVGNGIQASWELLEDSAASSRRNLRVRFALRKSISSSTVPARTSRRDTSATQRPQSDRTSRPARRRSA